MLTIKPAICLAVAKKIWLGTVLSVNQSYQKHGAYSREQNELRARLREIEEENRAVLAKLKELARSNLRGTSEGRLES